MSGITFQDSDLSTPPNGTKIETVTKAGGERQVVDIGSIAGTDTAALATAANQATEITALQALSGCVQTPGLFYTFSYGVRSAGTAVGTIFFDGAAGTPILNVGGNGRQWTGLSLPGSAYAGQIDIASVGGTSISGGAVLSKITDNNTGSSVGWGITAAGYGQVSIQAVGSSGPLSGAALPVQQLAVATGAYSYAHVNANASATNIKNGAGTLAAVVVNTKGASANVLTLYDSTGAASGTIAVIDVTSAVGAIPYNLAFANGLTYALATGSAADVTFVYK